MIIYDLRCGRGHGFEGWFAGRGEFEREQKASRLACPVCGDQGIDLVPSGAHISRGKIRPPGESAPPPFLKAVQDFLEKNFEDVGDRFAEEAVRIHLGEAGERNIRGSMTEEEERELVDAGVGFAKVPFPRFSS